MTLVSKDGGKTFHEISEDFDPNTGVDRSLEAAKAKGYQPYVDVTKDGTQTFRIPAANDSLKAATAKGYQLADVKKNLDTSKAYAPQVGSLESAARGAAQGSTMNFADELAAKAGSLIHGNKYEDELAAQRERDSAAKNQHGNLYTAGDIAGSLIVPNPAAKLGLAGRAAGYAAQGAISGVGQSEDKSLSDAGIGSLYGLGGGAIGEAAGFAAKALAPEVARAAAGYQASKATGALKRDAQKIADLGGPEKFGGELLDQGIVKAFNSPKTTGELAYSAAQKAGEDVGSKLKSYGEKGVQVSLPDFAENVKTNIVSKLQEPGTPMELKQIGQQIESEVGHMVNDFKDSNGMVTPEVANGIKSKIYDLVYRNQRNPSTSDKEKRAMARTLMQSVDDSIGNTLGDAEKGAFQQAKRNYGVATTAAGIGEDAAERQLANRSVPLSSQLAGVAGASAGENPVQSGILAGAAALANKLALQYGNSTAAAGLNGLSKVLQTKPAKLSRQALEAIDAASKRGNSALVATHLMLMSKDPDYKKAIEDSQ